MIKANHLTKNYRSPIKEGGFFKNLFKRTYREVEAVHDVNFEIPENQLVGFIGPNGAGKTTTLKMLAGILYPTTGTIDILGFTPFDKKPEFLKQIAFIMGNRNQLLWDLPATDTFLLNKEIYEVSDHDYHDVVDKLSSQLRCEKLLSTPVKSLSLGERMKMELIAGLVHKPKVIFFDEPTIGLDIFSQETIRDFIKEYKKESKASIILTSHYLEDVKQLAERLIIIDKGHILYDGSLSSILEKYSREKRISLTLEKQIPEATLKTIGPIESFRFPKIVFSVDRGQLNKTLAKINKKLSYSDMTVEDDTIEEIIKSFFKEQGRS